MTDMDTRRIRCHHIDEVDVTETTATVTFYGRNSNGTKQCFKVEFDRTLFFWFITVRCRKGVNDIKGKLQTVVMAAAHLFNQTPF